MTFDSLIDVVLTEGKNLNLQRYQLYVDLNDKLLKHKENKKPDIEDVKLVCKNFHCDYYQDLSKAEVDKIKKKFQSDFLEKRNFEVALGGLEGFNKD